MADHKVAIHWFRKGLRLHDNPALCAAVDGAEAVFPLFVIDPWFACPDKVGMRRSHFLLQSLQDLDNSLRTRNSQLFVARGKPEEVIPRLIEKWQATLLTFESDIEPYAKTRDASISKAARALGVTVNSFSSHTLFDPEQLFALAGGKVGTTYDPFLKLCSKAGPISQPVGVPSAINPPSDDVKSATASWNFEVPTLEEMGYAEEQPASPFIGGETHALTRMQSVLERKSYVCEFEKPKTAPTALTPSTTVLSPYLKFGCLSPRQFWHGIHKTYGDSKHTKPPVSLDGQLMWREFYYYIAAHTKNYDKMAGNPICRQVL
jgi:cryptochrome